jgi:septal ring factor EnvC (AmiA/AmiB activator)
MDIELAKIVLPIINMLLTVALWLAASRDSKDKATISSINRVEETLTSKINAQEQRVTRLERDIDYTPKHDDLGKIHDRINEVKDESSEIKGEMKEMKGELKQMSGQLTRLYQNEMDKKRP